jgi:hypothetical protein
LPTLGGTRVVICCGLNVGVVSGDEDLVVPSKKEAGGENGDVLFGFVSHGVIAVDGILLAENEAMSLSVSGLKDVEKLVSRMS